MRCTTCCASSAVLEGQRVVRTFGVCDFTFPARASEPWTLPMVVGVGYVIAFEPGGLESGAVSVATRGLVNAAALYFGCARNGVSLWGSEARGMWSEVRLTLLLGM